MSWKQIFERARKTGTFTDADLEMAKSWPHCAVGDMLCSRGYNKSHTSDELADIIISYNFALYGIGDTFFGFIYRSNTMPERKYLYNTEDEYHKECMRLVDEAEKIYDRIQKIGPNLSLRNHLNLKVAPVTSV